MIEKIIHISDIHIRKSPTRNAEYLEVFNNLIASIKLQKPDRIVIVGDLVHDYLDLQGEQLILACYFLNSLAEIAQVIITRGNHDFRKKAINRVDSIEAIVKSINNPNIVYYNATGFYPDDNIVWSVWKHGEKNNNPWNIKKYKKEVGKTYIDLYHNPINGCFNTDNMEMKRKSYIGLNEFRGDYLFAGDIHLQQYLDGNKTCAFSGSLIAQDFSEGDDGFHGYLLWDVVNKTVEEIPVKNDYSFKSIKITPYIDFNDLDIDIDEPTPNMRIRFVWQTLSQAKTKENISKLLTHVKSKYNVISIAHQPNFIDNVTVNSLVVSNTEILDNISSSSVQHDVFKEYLEKVGCDEKVIDDVIALDTEITSLLGNDESGSGEWNIIKFGGNNFRSYEKIDIDWRDMDGLYQIAGENTWGKTTIISLISYVLYGKILETENKQKFGDSRFVNNRIDVDFCDGYVIVESNGEYYGIKKTTQLKKTKTGELSAAVTSTSYFILKTPDDEMNADTSIDNLTEENKKQTQLKIDNIVGNYNNFQRTINTTADNLNNILSNDMAVFIDSLLFDSGLDIFDRKLTAYKDYEKANSGKIRLVCNVEQTKENIKEYEEKTILYEDNLKELEEVKIPEVEARIKKGGTYVENLIKKLFVIDQDIYNLNIDEAKADILTHEKAIEDLDNQHTKFSNLINPLPSSYDEIRLNLLIEQKDLHKTNEYDLKLKIKGFEQDKLNERHAIEIINGDIFRLKNDGVKKKNEIIKLRESKVCPTCGQDLDSEHKQHIEESIKFVEVEMFEIADKIKEKQNVDIKLHEVEIEKLNNNVSDTKTTIENMNSDMEDVLFEIGDINNIKNDVVKRLEYQNELNILPILKANHELKINNVQQTINNYNNSLLQIEENKKIEKHLELAKEKVAEITIELNDLRETVFIYKTNIGNMGKFIKTNTELMEAYFIQDYNDNINKLYKQCVHRDGIPREMLVNYIIPKINKTIESLLSNSLFNVWLDYDDLRPKLVYNSRPTAIIDCIGSSGKERTFSSVILKFALNQINTKAKPKVFLLDEVMGKLSGDSIEEFIEILNIIKTHMSKVIVIEQLHEINADYILDVTMNENGISNVTLN